MYSSESCGQRSRTDASKAVKDRAPEGTTTAHTEESMFGIVTSPIAIAAFSPTVRTPPVAIDWKAVEASVGRTSATQSGHVHRFNMLRSDLKVTVDRINLAQRLREALDLTPAK